MYTARGLSDMGESLSSGKLANSSLARLWKKIHETGKPFTVDVAFYPPSGTASWFIGVPVMVSEQGQAPGILVLRLAPITIDNFASTSDRMKRRMTPCCWGRTGRCGPPRQRLEGKF